MKIYVLIGLMGLVAVSAKSLSDKENTETDKEDFPHTKDYYDGYIRAIVDNYNDIFNSGRNTRSADEGGLTPQEKSIKENQQEHADNNINDGLGNASGNSTKEETPALGSNADKIKHEKLTDVKQNEPENKDSTQINSELDKNKKSEHQTKENSTEVSTATQQKDEQHQLAGNQSNANFDPNIGNEHGKLDDDKSDTKDSESATPETITGDNVNKSTNEAKDNKEIAGDQVEKKKDEIENFAPAIGDNDESESGSGDAEQAVQRNLIEVFTNKGKKDDAAESLGDIKHYNGNGDDFEDMKKRDVENDNNTDKEENKTELSDKQNEKDNKDSRDYESDSKVISHSSSTYTPGDPNKVPNNSNQQTPAPINQASPRPAVNADTHESEEKQDNSKPSKKSAHSRNVKTFREDYEYEMGDYRPRFTQKKRFHQGRMISPVIYGTMIPTYMYNMPVYKGFGEFHTIGSRKSKTPNRALKRDKGHKDHHKDNDEDDHQHVYIAPLTGHPGGFEYGHGIAPIHFGDEQIHGHHDYYGEHDFYGHHGHHGHHGYHGHHGNHGTHWPMSGYSYGYGYPILVDHDDGHGSCTCNNHHEHYDHHHEHGHHFPGHFNAGWPWFY